MPIKIPATLPAYDVLTREGVMVVDEDLAAKQDIRPLRIALLNLMPKKIQTENQLHPQHRRRTYEKLLPPRQRRLGRKV